MPAAPSELQDVVVAAEDAPAVSKAGGAASVKADGQRSGGGGTRAKQRQSQRRGRGALDAACSFALSPNFQLAVQLAAGCLLVSLVSLVDSLRFVNSCSAWVWFLVSCVMASPNCHVGTRLRSVVGLLGNALVALIPAGALLSLGRLLGNPKDNPAPATAFFCALSPAVISVLVINRVTPNPPWLWAAGMDTLLLFGAMMMQGATAWPIDTGLWRDALGAATFAGLAAGCAATVAVSLLVLPTLASDEVRLELSSVLTAAGHAHSRTMARVLCPPGRLPGCPPNVLLLGQAVVQLLPGLRVPDEAGDDEETVRRQIYARARRAVEAHPPSTSGAPSAPRCGKPLPPPGGGGGSSGAGADDEVGPLGQQTACSVEAAGAPMYALGPRLRGAELLIAAAAAEPPWLAAAPFDAGAFRALAAAVRRLLSSLSAFESILEDDCVINEASHGTDYVNTLRDTSATLAAFLSRLGDALSASSGRNCHCFTGACAGGCGCGATAAAVAAALRAAAAARGAGGWEGVRQRLRDALREEQRGYWEGLRGGHVEAPATAWSLVQARAVFFSYSAAQAAIDSAEAVGAAAEAALGPFDSRSCCPSPACCWRGSGRNTANGGGEATTAIGGGDGGGGGGGCGRDGGGKVGVQRKRAAAPSRVAWLRELRDLFMARALWSNWRTVFGATLPRALGSLAGMRGLLSSRIFQAGLKMWGVFSLLLVASLLLLLLHPAFERGAGLNIASAYIAAVLSMSERTEATVSKVASWLFAATLGETLGFAVMSSPAAAASPAALAAALCAAALCAGCLGVSRFRIAITLALMQMGAEVLCQYRGCCGLSKAALPYYLSRVASVWIGVLSGAAASAAVLPWFTSAWALETMGAAFVAAARLPAFGYAKVYEDARATVSEANRRRAAAAAEAAAAEGRGAWPAAQAGGAPGAASAAADAEGAQLVSKQGDEAAAAAARAAGEAVLSAAPPVAAFSDRLCRGVVAPLTAVQASLLRDTTLWRRGVLSTPCVVPETLHAMLLLLIPLEAMLSSLRPPDISGAFHGPAFDRLVLRMHPTNVVVIGALQLVAAAVAEHLAAPTDATAARLTELVEDLLRRRVAARAEMASARAAFHAVMAGDGWGAEGAEVVNVDEGIRVLGFQHAWVRSFDRAVAVARVALRAECRARATATAVLQ